MKHPKVALLREWGSVLENFGNWGTVKVSCAMTHSKGLCIHMSLVKRVFIYCYPGHLKINVQILGLSRQNGVLLVPTHFVILKNSKVKQLPIAVDALSLIQTYVLLYII